MPVHRVFITGANGFVGRHLAAHYRARGVEVAGVDLVADPETDVVRGSTTDPAPWEGQLAGCDAVVHTAAIVSNNIDPVRAWEVNVVGTQRVLDAAARAGVHRFVQLSSIAALGFLTHHYRQAQQVNPGPVDERYPVMPCGNPYTDSKIAGEHTVLAAHAAGEIEVTVIRPADVYGPASRPWVLEPIRLMRAGMFVLPAHGRATFTPVYVDDLVDGIVRAVDSPAAAGRIITLGGAEGVTTADYFGRLARMIGKRPPRAVPTAVAQALVVPTGRAISALGRPTELGRGAVDMLTRAFVFDNSTARDLLTWSPRFTLDAGMDATEAWLRSEGLLGSR